MLVNLNIISEFIIFLLCILLVLINDIFIFVCLTIISENKIIAGIIQGLKRRISFAFTSGLGALWEHHLRKVQVRTSFLLPHSFFRGYSPFQTLHLGRNWLLKSIPLPQEAAKTRAQFPAVSFNRQIPLKAAFSFQLNLLNFQFLLILAR